MIPPLLVVMELLSTERRYLTFLRQAAGLALHHLSLRYPF